MLLIIAKFNLLYIWGSFTLLLFLSTLTKERPIKPYKCISAYLITPADKTKCECLYSSSYILTDTHLNCDLKVLFRHCLHCNPMICHRQCSFLLNMLVKSLMNIMQRNLRYMYTYLQNWFLKEILWLMYKIFTKIYITMYQILTDFQACIYHVSSASVERSFLNRIQYKVDGHREHK